jgi:hypothetical protein
MKFLKLRNVFALLLLLMLFTFNSFAQTYSISGTIKETNGTPISGVQLSIFGNGIYNDRNTDTDINGFYIFSDLREDDFIILRLFHSDYLLDPTNITIRGFKSNLTYDFVGTKRPTHIQLSGTIKDEDDTPLSDVTVILSNGDPPENKTTTTDINGFYGFQNLPVGPYSIRPSKYDFAFNPPSIYIDYANTDKTNLNFTGHKGAFHTISGTIKDTANKPISGVLVDLLSNWGGALYDITTTNSNGFYIFPDLFSKINYIVVPSHTKYGFDPRYRNFDGLFSDIKDADFVGIEIYNISCKIVDANNRVINGVTIQISGDISDEITTIDEFGYYTFSNLHAGGSYTIIPFYDGYSFEPASITITSLNSNEIPIFTAKAIMSVNKPDELPSGYKLEQNYPNPFNPSTKIKYAVKESGFVTINLFDVFGREVRKLVNTVQPSGNYEIIFDAMGLTSGVYYYKININEFTATKKMLLMK